MDSGARRSALKDELSQAAEKLELSTVLEMVARQAVSERTSGAILSPTRNIAAESTDCDILAFLDDDATAVPEWIESFLAAYEGLR